MALACLLVSSTARAERLSPDQVPAELRDWIPWVLDEVGDEACTLADGERVCVWLGRLSLNVSPTGGRFRLELLTERATRVPLPGSTKHWPAGVKVGTEPGVVLDVSGVPWIALSAGRHTVEGRFSWRKLPELLPVPSSVARVIVKSDDRVVTAPRREADGAVWLGGSTSEEDTSAAEPERLEIEVMRRIEDGVPLVVTTKVILRVGGRPREVRLEHPLLEGGVLLELESKKLPARFEQDGVLVLEAKKGKHVVRIRERHGGSVEALKLVKRAEPWPTEEVWAWRPAVALRQAEVSGGSPIDPSRTNLPGKWRKLQAFKLRAPTSFSFKTLRRGNPEPQPNRLSLRRSLRLDLDGEGFTVVDQLHGAMHRDWRLGFLAKGELGQVSKAGLPIRDHLITNEPGSNRPGVELRDGEVNVFAEWRGEGTPSRLAAVGWATDVDHLAVELRLPPGWELLGASGVDQVSPSRLNGWDVLDLVWVLLIALGVGKLTRWHWAPVAALVMALCHESLYAPWWSWGGLLATMALLHYLPAGRPQRFARVAWWGASAVLVFGLLSFAALEVRALVYPHAQAKELAAHEWEEKETEQIAEDNADNKEGGTGTRARGEEGSMGARSRALHDAAEFGMIGTLNAGAGGDPDAPTAPWGRDDSLGTDPTKHITPPRQPQQDPKAVIQTGHGIPRWEFTSATLKWVGPVEQGHQIRLWLLSPTLRAALTVLALALAAWLAVIRDVRRPRQPLPPS
ncbi:MAG: hypothetical protein JRI68_03510 [Deltaproteobacteria bacterium]|nr:hypothetical protein [Deltaproteobacteria bacterium]